MPEPEFDMTRRQHDREHDAWEYRQTMEEDPQAGE